MKTKLWIYGALFLLITTASVFGFRAYKDYREDQERLAIYAQLIPFINLEDTQTFEETADAVRLFMHEHTEYSDGPEFYAIWGNHPVIADKILAHVKNDTDMRAPLECSSRSGAMEYIFRNLGYNVRAVSVFRHAKSYGAHTFTEIQNPETGEWHIQDSQYNIFWRFKDSKKRAGIHDLVSTSLDQFKPCITERQCGWRRPNREGQNPKNLKSLFGIADIKDYMKDERTLLTNAERFDLNTPITFNDKTALYCKHFKKHCRDKIITY